MSICFEKARELGDLILASEASIQLADASAEFSAHPEAQAKLDEYTSYQKNVQDSMPVMSAEERGIATKRLAEMVIELKQDPIVGALVFAENEFSSFVNQVMNIVKMTVMGEPPAGDCSGCSGGSCDGCH